MAPADSVKFIEFFIKNLIYSIRIHIVYYEGLVPEGLCVFVIGHKILIVFLSWFFATAAFSSIPTQVRDINGHLVAPFMAADHTIVIGFDRSTQDDLTKLVEDVIEEFSGDAGERTQQSSGLPLKGIRVLFVYDARGDIIPGFRQQTARFNGQRRRLARRFVVKRAPQEIAVAVKQIDPTLRRKVQEHLKGFISPGDVQVVSLYKNEWKVRRMEGQRRRTGRPIIKRQLIAEGSTYITMQKYGPSARLMRSLFGSTEPGLRVAIHSPEGERITMWSDVIQPREVMQTYFQHAGDGAPEPDMLLVAMQASDEDAVEDTDGESVDGKEKKNPFDALIKNAKKYGYKDLKTSVTDIKAYVEKLEVCTKSDPSASAQHLEVFYWRAFSRISREVDGINNAFQSWSYRTAYNLGGSLLAFVETATHLLRRYYMRQADHFTGGIDGLASVDKEHLKTLDAVYVQLADMLKQDAKEASEIDKIWKKKAHKLPKKKKQWSPYFKALDQLPEDSAYCGELIEAAD